MKYNLLILSIILVTILNIVNSSINIISNDGISKGSSYINNFIYTKLSDEPIDSIPLVSLIDCTNDGKGVNIANDLLSTSFESITNGISFDISKGKACIYSSFDSILSPKFSGCHSIDYYKSLSSSPICLLANYESLDEVLLAYSQIFRRILSADNSNRQLVIVISKGNLDNINIDDINNKIKDSFISNEIITSEQFDSSVKVLLKSNDIESNTVISDEIVRYSESNTIESSGLGYLLADSWTKISKETIKPILSKSEKLSLLIVESAYSSANTYSETFLSDWQNRVGKGKLISNFNKRAIELLDSVMNKYRQKTIGTLISKERTQRSQQLYNTIVTTISYLYKQQIEILTNQIINSFNKLLKDYYKNDQLVDDVGQKLIKQKVYEFQIKSNTLDIKTFNLLSTDIYNSLSTTLETILNEFPKSNTFKLENLKKLEKKVKKSSNKRGKGKFNIALSLVGMFRPPGYGNLQGYANYATSLAGLPFDLLFGVQNDGESPEIIGEDREFPILRLQPKINFDIDL